METTWRIVRIFDEYRVAIRADAPAISVGDRLEVFSRSGEVKDPETGEVLGTIVFRKATLKVTQVQEKMVIGETEMEMPDYTAAFRLSGMIPESIRTKMIVRPEEVEGGWPSKDSRMVRVGDLVRKIEKATPPQAAGGQ